LCWDLCSRKTEVEENEEVVLGRVVVGTVESVLKKRGKIFKTKDESPSFNSDSLVCPGHGGDE
jgi:hypothetical protein